jgi:hypothetical protein
MNILGYFLISIPFLAVIAVSMKLSGWKVGLSIVGGAYLIAGIIFALIFIGVKLVNGG